MFGKKYLSLHYLAAMTNRPFLGIKKVPTTLGSKKVLTIIGRIMLLSAWIGSKNVPTILCSIVQLPTILGSIIQLPKILGSLAYFSACIGS